MSSLNGTKFLLFGFIIVLLIAIPLTVLTLQKSQETRSRATPATTLKFEPQTVTKNVGDIFTLDIVVTPGSNQISFAKFIITYDQTKLATEGGGIALIPPNPADIEAQGFTSILEGPTFTPGKITLTASVGTDPQRAIQTTSTVTSTKVATLTFKAIGQTTGGVATQVAFDPPPESQLLSLAAADQVSENVLLPNNSPAQITIGAGAAPTNTPTPTSTASPSATTNKPPVCTNLNVDRTTSGVAPFSITFTGNGNDPDGTIKKITFDFGDGPVQDVIPSGVPSNSVSAQLSHTYNNSGVFKAKVTFTDDKNAISVTSDTCTQTITVTGGPSVTPGVGTPTATPTATLALSPTETPTSVPQPTLSQPGPGNALFGIGAIGAVITVIGFLLFLAL